MKEEVVNSAKCSRPSGQEVNIFHWVAIMSIMSETPKMLWFIILEDSVEASKQRVCTEKS